MLETRLFRILIFASFVKLFSGSDRDSFSVLDFRKDFHFELKVQQGTIAACNIMALETSPNAFRLE